MTSSLRGLGIAAVAVLGLASACLAADGYEQGRGGIGGQIGVSSFRLDRVFGDDWFGDYSAGAYMRLSFSGHWRYAMTPSFRWQIGPGYTWSAYKAEEPAPMVDPNFPDDPDKSDYLVQMIPVSAQLHYTYKNGGWVYYGGLGPGVYRVWVQNNRKVLKDPVSLKLHRGLYPGGSAQFGVERFLKSLPSSSVEFSLAGHLAFAQRDDQFPSGYNSNAMALTAHVGFNYYFVPGQPRKPQQTGTTPASP